MIGHGSDLLGLYDLFLKSLYHQEALRAAFSPTFMRQQCFAVKIDEHGDIAHISTWFHQPQTPCLRRSPAWPWKPSHNAAQCAQLLIVQFQDAGRGQQHRHFPNCVPCRA